jgi:transcriptional regulator with XRE-family HTH domain
MGNARPRPKRLAEKLLMIRQQLGVSQDGMIKRLGIEDEFERERISKFERDIIEPPLHVLVAYAEVANVYVEVLIKDDLDLPATLPSRKKSEGIKREK